MTSYLLDKSGAESCGKVGGTIFLPRGSDWPQCAMCGTDLVAFIDLVVPADADFAAGSRLQVFACRTHNDIAGTIYSGYSVFDDASQSETLPVDYWSISDGHYFFHLLTPDTAVDAGRTEATFVEQLLFVTTADAPNANGFKLLGNPFWLQDPENHTCSCGAPMKLLLQVPESHPFPKSESAEPQADSFSNDDYCLFLGNQLYLLACTQQCNPRALWPVLQG